MNAQAENAPVPGRPMAARKRKFLVVVDDSSECQVALRFAAGRAGHVEGGGIILFHVIPPSDFQHWIAVEDRMREEAYEAAEELMRDVAARVYDYSGVPPEIIIRTGQPKEELQAFIEQEPDLFALFLGANSGGDPGPLVDYFSGPLVGSLSCPVVIVPGCLSEEQIDEMV